MHGGMTKPIAVRFSVLPENEEAAVAHISARGYSPMQIERNVEGLTVLVFPPLAGEALEKLVKTMPVHLNAKIGIVVGDAPPFAALH